MLKLSKYPHGGLTLIELLVVVLIIGILAAIALPQYQKVLDKARIVKLMPLIDAIMKSQEMYFITNGKYAVDLSNLDIEVTNSCIWGGTRNHQIWCSGMVLNNGHTSGNAVGALEFIFCPSQKNPEQWTNYMNCYNAQELSVEFAYHYPNEYLQEEDAGKVSCSSTTERGQRLESIFCH